MRFFPLIFLLFLLFLFLMMGCASFGLKRTEQCDAQYARRVERMQCYHQSAIAAAYLERADLARQTCERIWIQLGAPYVDDDLKKRAELEGNNCYMDIAKIIGDQNICASIGNRRGDFSVSLLGEVSTQELCLDLANKARARRNQIIFNSRNSICSAVYILPLILIFYMSSIKITQRT